MNILYITRAFGNPWAGPTYSVPRQIEAQSKVDNVFWYNLYVSRAPEWKNLSYYHDIQEFPQGTISSLPEPFNKPDIVVVEQFYKFAGNKVKRELIHSGLPYVIIPRGELTYEAQKKKWYKKLPFNLLVMNAFARNALAIQYLTQQEKDDSGEKWNKNSLVIPNGIDMPEIEPKMYDHDGMRCLSLGRISPHHKGLDLLLEACALVREELLAANVHVLIAGPDREKKLSDLQTMVEKLDLKKIVDFSDALYEKEKVAALKEHDAFLMTSRYEGHPVAMIEALSYGLPCLATTGSNMRTDVEWCDAGWGADNTAESIAASLKSMLGSSKEDLVQKSVNAIDLARQFDKNVLAEKNHEEYERLLAQLGE